MNILDRSAYDRLVELGAFSMAKSVLEIGSGTGGFADRLLKRELQGDTLYQLTEVSPVLTKRLERRFAGFSNQVRVQCVEMNNPYPFTGPFDRIVSAYVHDTMPLEDLQWHMDELHRLLAPGGKLCMAITGGGTSKRARLMMRAWHGLFSLNPSLVGGSRVVDLVKMLDSKKWEQVESEDVDGLGFASRVIIATR